MLSTLYVITRTSVRMSVCHMGASVKNGCYDYAIFTYGSPTSLVFAGKVSSRNSNELPTTGGFKQGRGGKTSHFLTSISRKRQDIRVDP